MILALCLWEICISIQNLRMDEQTKWWPVGFPDEKWFSPRAGQRYIADIQQKKKKKKKNEIASIFYFKHLIRYLHLEQNRLQKQTHMFVFG